MAAHEAAAATCAAFDQDEFFACARYGELEDLKKELDTGRAATNILNGLVDTGQIKQRKDGTWFVPGAEKK